MTVRTDPRRSSVHGALDGLLAPVRTTSPAVCYLAILVIICKEKTRKKSCGRIHTNAKKFQGSRVHLNKRNR